LSTALCTAVIISKKITFVNYIITILKIILDKLFLICYNKNSKESALTLSKSTTALKAVGSLRFFNQVLVDEKITLTFEGGALFFFVVRDIFYQRDD